VTNPEVPWRTFDFTGSAEAFLQFAAQFGTPVPSRPDGGLVDSLRPADPSVARPRSMSALYGTGAFPFHTDAAYLRTPPRYIFLRIVAGETQARPTLLLPFRESDFPASVWNSLRRDVWLVNGGRGRFLTSIVNETASPGKRIARFDKHCMRPYIDPVSESEQAVDEYVANAPISEHSWEPEVILMIDNWSALHARAGAASLPDDNRVLERILINC
jgi:alpha-ketoglutarate-dependent taurine dioxygenase